MSAAEEGRTVANWTGVIIILFGALIMAIAVMIPSVVLFVVGVVVVIGGVVTGRVLSLAGYGAKRTEHGGPTS